jgi:hypothetical protein
MTILISMMAGVLCALCIIRNPQRAIDFFHSDVTFKVVMITFFTTVLFGLFALVTTLIAGGMN